MSLKDSVVIVLREYHNLIKELLASFSPNSQITSQDILQRILAKDEQLHQLIHSRMY